MKKILIRVYLVLLSLCIISLIVLSVLGAKSRVGYLDKLSFNDNISYHNNYVYGFRISYYDKVFRNSDIYGVYLVTNSLPKYVKEVKMKDESGTPFGTLISFQKISEDEKIDNVKYILKIKFKFFKYFIILNIIILILFLSKIEFYYKRYSKDVRTRYVLVISLFILFTVFPKFIYLAFYDMFDHNNYENRKFKEYPNIYSNFIDYPKNYEAYFNDYLPFRNDFINLRKYIDRDILKEKRDKDRIYGDDGNLYSLESIKYRTGEIRFSESELELISSNLLNFRDELKKNGTDFVLFIAPNKESIYYEGIPDYIKFKETNSIDELTNYLIKNTDLKIVYPKNEILKYKDKYELYYIGDGHWNNISGYIGYLALMKELDITNNIIDIDNVTVLKGNSLDVYVLSNYTTNKFKIIEGSNNHYYSGYDSYYCHSVSDSTNNMNILFVRDSFGYHMFNYIASSFKETIFLHRYVFDTKYLIDNNIDLVVLQIAEFGLKDTLMNISNWKIEKLNKDL